jgi:hypothetical protein
MKLYLQSILLVFILTGCSTITTDKTPPLELAGFSNLKTIPLDVSRIEYDSYVRRGANTWDVADDLSTPPNIAMQNYLNQRFKPNSDSGVLKIDLEKAQVSISEVKNENKILSYIPLANMSEYVFEIVVGIENQYQVGTPNTRNTLRFVRKKAIPLNKTMAYREALLQTTLEELIRDFDEGLLNMLANQYKIMRFDNSLSLSPQTELPETESQLGVYIKNIQDEAEKKIEEARQNRLKNATSGATPQNIVPLNE